VPAIEYVIGMMRLFFVLSKKLNRVKPKWHKAFDDEDRERKNPSKGKPVILKPLVLAPLLKK